MRKGQLEDCFASAGRNAAIRSILDQKQTRDKKLQRARSGACATGKSTAAKVPSKTKPSKAPAQFAPLPLQQARVLQQLQAFSLNKDTAAHSAPQTSHATSHPARQKQGLIPQKKPTVPKQYKLQSFCLDSAGNTDSEVESPVSQPPAHSCSASLAAQPELDIKASPFLETASASTPARSAPQAFLESIADSPESMAMSTPACGQQPPSSEASPLVPMSCCSTAGNASADHPKAIAQPPFGSPMCISPDTWATPQQLQWELSSDSLSALQDSPHSAPTAHASSPTASQLQAANLHFGFDAIKGAAASGGGGGGGGGGARSRLASSTLADQLSEAGSSGSGEGGFDGDADWMEDLEVTQSPSQSSGDGHYSDSAQGALHLSLDSDEDPHSLPQVTNLAADLSLWWLTFVHMSVQHAWC